MAFVNEFVPEDQEFDPSIFYNPMNRAAVFKPFRWTIDHNKGVYLICVGGGGREAEIPFSFVMRWADEFIRIDAVKKPSEDEVGGVILDWDVVSVDFPSELGERKDELLSLIEKAFKTMGNQISRSDGILKVNVNFNF